MVTAYGNRVAAAWLGLVVLVLGGCCTPGTMKPMNVQVTPDSRLLDERGQMTPVELNLIGVTDAERDRWAGYSINQFWSVNDPLRKTAAKYVMQFSGSDPKPKTLSKNNLIWRRWKQNNAMHLVVVAFLPGATADQGPRDPRRVIVPLDSCAWGAGPFGGGEETIQITVQPAGLLVVTQPKQMEKE